MDSTISPSSLFQCSSHTFFPPFHPCTYRMQNFFLKLKHCVLQNVCCAGVSNSSKKEAPVRSEAISARCIWHTHQCHFLCILPVACKTACCYFNDSKMPSVPCSSLVYILTQRTEHTGIFFLSLLLLHFQNKAKWHGKGVNKPTVEINHSCLHIVYFERVNGDGIRLYSLF